MNAVEVAAFPALDLVAAVVALEFVFGVGVRFKGKHHPPGPVRRVKITVLAPLHYCLLCLPGAAPLPLAAPA